MRLFRTMLSMLIALALAMMPVVSAQAAAHASSMLAATADVRLETGMASAGDMADCHETIGHDTTGDHSCCNSKSTCPDQAACMAKCCKVVGVVWPAIHIAELVRFSYRPAVLEKPPSWASEPPAPPPRS